MALPATAQARAVDTDAPPPPPKTNVLDPSTFALIGLGLVGLAVFRRRTHRNDEA